jgi:hypothetical protein
LHVAQISASLAVQLASVAATPLAQAQTFGCVVVSVVTVVTGTVDDVEVDVLPTT